MEHLKGSEEAIWTFHEQYPGKPRSASFVHKPPSLQELV